ncbi:MAG: DUF7059 domain-containing protein [Actinomycetaceae bacterium]
MPQLPEESLAGVWRRAGFTPDGVARLLGPVAQALLASGDRAPALRALEGATGPAAAWTRLFVLGQGVAAADLVPAGAPVQEQDPQDGPDPVVVLVALGMAAFDGERVEPLVGVTPAELGDRAGWVLADLLVPGREPAHEHVIGVGAATRTLDSLAVRPAPGERFLDVGTGSGYLALRAAALGAEVVATDVNPRALALTGLGAELSGVSVDARLGSLLAPAHGRFDTIVSNPPFVISGRAGEDGATYRDGGAAGDGLVAELLAGVGDHLAPGGTAQLLANWEHVEGADWRDRVAGWVDPALDLWVVQRDAVDPATYVDTWLRDGGAHPAAGRDSFERAADRWLGDLEARGVTAIGMGHVTVRRRGEEDPGGPAWRRLEEATGPVRQRLGEHVAGVLDAVALLRPALGDDAALLGSRLAVAPDVTEVRHHRPGAAEAEVIELVQGGGYGRTVRASTGLAAVVGACDGELTLGTLVTAVAGLLEVDADALTAELVWWLRELLATGMLVPAPSSSSAGDPITVQKETP